MNITIWPNTEKQACVSAVPVLCDYLVKKNVNVLIPETYSASLVNPSHVTFQPLDVCLKNCDLLIALGGDGTVLRAARHISPYGVPILGINLGRLGYITSIEMSEIELLDKFINGLHTIDTRMMFDVELLREGKVIEKFLSLNDAVLSKGAFSRIIDLSLRCNSEFITSYRADGVIISTPTGSTAYSLSAGGPIIEPCVESIIVNPICPHSLASRPIVFSPNSVIEFSVMSRDRDVYLTVDGEDNAQIMDGDIVKITRSKYVTKFITLKNSAFYNTLCKKLKEM